MHHYDLPLLICRNMERSRVGEITPSALSELGVTAIGGHAGLVRRLAWIAEVHRDVALSGVDDGASGVRAVGCEWRRGGGVGGRGDKMDFVG